MIFVGLASLTQFVTGQGSFAPYADVQSVLRSLDEILPAALKTGDQSQRAAAWPVWISDHDRQIRDRLVRGDEDTLVNWLFFGTTFTAQPRVAFAPGASAESEALPLVKLRAHDLVGALAAPGRDERRLFARVLLEGRGLRVGTIDERARVEASLLTEVARVFGEWRQYAMALDAARAQGDASADFAARSKLFRERGLSLDTTIQPSFALERALGEMKARGLVRTRSLRRVAVIGPGLDFSDKGSGYDFYPQQTLQPFALIDTLRRLDLLDSQSGMDATVLTTLDISPRVNDHLRRSRATARAGGGYRLHLPLDAGVSWKPELIDFWKRAGSEIGAEIREATPSALGSQVRMRVVNVRPKVVQQVASEDLNIVTERLAGARFDLVVATNVFVYYDTLDQCLAFANAGAMLAPGAFLLSNNALLELPGSQVHSVGYITVQYSDRTDDGDHIVWYQKNGAG